MTETVAIKPETRRRLERHRRFYVPSEPLRMLEWCRRHARNIDGRAYSHEAYPHLGAPGGPCDAFDDVGVRKIWLQFASRLGKTFIGQCATLRKAHSDPGPMMFASSDEKTAIEVVERTYAMMSESPCVAGQLRPPHQRRQSRIMFDACQCSVAWSRSVSTLSDKEVEFGHANEIDNWEHLSTSKQADPLKLFSDRFKNRPHHKAVLESIPTVKRRSRVERGRLGSSNCTFCVPCPHCGRYQVLEMSQLKWDKLENGKSDKDLARSSARYHCQHCDGLIDDHHRPAMMRAGVWCPEGCSVRDAEAQLAAIECGTLDDDYHWPGWSEAPWIAGIPVRDSNEAGYKLSSLYALSLTWGDIAAEFVSCKDRAQDLRNFINQWLAETWEHVKRQVTWERLGSAMIDPKLPRCVVPQWSSILTCGVDRQDEDGSRLPWCIVAWGPEQVATIGYGEAVGFELLLSEVIQQQFAHADGGPSLPIAFTIVDSGYRPDGVYEFCLNCHANGLYVWPGKGSQNALDCEYRRSVLGPNTSRPGMELIFVDTIRSQLWLEDRLHSESNRIGLHAGSLLEHQDYLQQLLNDAPVNKLNADNNVRQSWQRLNEHLPNDFRDCLRYAYVAMLIATGGEVPTRVVGDADEVSVDMAVLSSGVQRHQARW